MENYPSLCMHKTSIKLHVYKGKKENERNTTHARGVQSQWNFKGGSGHTKDDF